VVEGNVLNRKTLDPAVEGQDASLGIDDEVPGKFGAWNRRNIGPYLPPFFGLCPDRR
jgi:hypothetical protein